jgi:chemotaxis regulatin CheY-phosphate phosphatase CheZ
MATVLAGELEPLQRGILAGAQMAALRNQIVLGRAESARRDSELQLQRRQMFLNELMAGAQRGYVNSMAAVGRATAALKQGQVTAGLPAKEAAAAEAATAASGAATLSATQEQRGRRVSQLLDPTEPTLDGITELAKLKRPQWEEALGRPMEDNEFMAIIQEAMNMSEMAADEVKDQRRRTAAYEGSVIAQQMQAAAAAGSKIDQGQKMLLEDELTERAELREALRKHRGSRRWQLDIESDTYAEDKKAYDATTKRYEQEIADLTQAIEGRAGNLVRPMPGFGAAAPTGGGTVGVSLQPPIAGLSQDNLGRYVLTEEAQVDMLPRDRAHTITWRGVVTEIPAQTGD